MREIDQACNYGKSTVAKLLERVEKARITRSIDLKACLADKESWGEIFNIAYGGRVYLNDLYFRYTNY